MRPIMGWEMVYTCLQVTFWLSLVILGLACWLFLKDKDNS